MNEDEDANAVSAHKGQAPKEVVESIKFISIPAGSYVVSRNTWDYVEGQTVTLGAFELGKTPVTIGQYKQCVEAGGCSLKHYNPNQLRDGCLYTRGKGYQNHPMNCINWYGAKEYCEWIGARLPTEYEWEYAATHDGKKHRDQKYPWGHFLSKSKANYEKRIGMPTEVGKYSPKGDSPLGLVDMVGNVQEWTFSKVPNIGTTSFWYVTKGGAWNEHESLLEVSNSSKNNPEWGYDYNGFRCARSLDAP